MFKYLRVEAWLWFKQKRGQVCKGDAPILQLLCEAEFYFPHVLKKKKKK